jgi:hypothetical protein
VLENLVGGGSRTTGDGQCPSTGSFSLFGCHGIGYGCYCWDSYRTSETSPICSANVNAISVLTFNDTPHPKQALFPKSRLHLNWIKSRSKAFAMPWGHLVRVCWVLAWLSARQTMHLFERASKLLLRFMRRVTASASVTMVVGIAEI